MGIFLRHAFTPSHAPLEGRTCAFPFFFLDPLLKRPGIMPRLSDAGVFRKDIKERIFLPSSHSFVSSFSHHLSCRHSWLRPTATPSPKDCAGPYSFPLFSSFSLFTFLVTYLPSSSGRLRRCESSRAPYLEPTPSLSLQ